MLKKKIYCSVTNDLLQDQRMHRICLSLQTAGYQLTLVGRKQKDSLPLPDRPYAQKRLNCFFQAGKFFYIEYQLRLFFFLLFQQFDILCAVDLDSLPAGHAAARLKGKRLVFDAHEYFEEMPEVVRRPKIRAIWAWIARHYIPKVDLAYTVCQSLADLFEEQHGQPFGVIRNLPLAQPKAQQAVRYPENGPLILIYQGMLNEGRGLEELLAALADFSPQEVQLWLLGKGDKMASLQEQAQSLNLGEQLKFWGFLPAEELQKITPQAHLGLNLLKHQGQSYYFSLANKFFDYVQAEKPSLNMAFPEYQRHLAEYEVALLLEELSPKAISRAIRRLLDEPQLYQQLQANCRLAKQDWLWEKEAQKLLTYYEAL